MHARYAAATLAAGLGVGAADFNQLVFVGRDGTELSLPPSNEANRVVPPRQAPAPSETSPKALAAVAADALPGSLIKDWAANPMRHTVSISLQPADAGALDKIKTAQEARPGTNSWSTGAKLGIKLPYALTKDALTHYTGLVEAYQKRSWKSVIEPSSSAKFSAAVSFHNEFKMDGRSFREVDVVQLKLTFQANFTVEATQGLHFNKTRTVVLDREGRVIAIFGDGPTEGSVLAI